MKKSSLEIIQIFMKVAQVLSKVVNVFCLIGAIACVAGSILLGFAQNAIHLGNVVIHGFIEVKDFLPVQTGYTGMAIGLVLCLSRYFLSNKAYQYFSNELNANTPFTFEGAEELKKLGFYNIFVSIAAVIIVNIIYVTMSNIFEGILEMNFNDVETVGIGAMMLVMSVIFKYGAEVMEKTKGISKENVETN